MQYLQQHRAAINLKFWLACKHLQDTVEKREFATPGDVQNCMELVLAGRAANMHVQVHTFFVVVFQP